MGSYLGIDWGGTYVKAGILGSNGKIVKKVVYASKKLGQKKNFIREIDCLIKGFKSYNIKGIGIGAPGIINIKNGFIYYLPNIPGWKNFPLAATLKKKFKLPVFVDNDANLFALAESRYGAAKDKSRSIFLTLGTGLGGSIIFNKKILNDQISALELGHVPVSLKGQKCGCGSIGCIETFVGNKYLLKRYRQLKKNKTKVNDISQVYEKALKGEPEAILLWREFSYCLGKFLSGMVNIFNPQVIIFGGGVSGAFKVFKPYLWETLKACAIAPQLKGLKLVRAQLKDAGIIGAALLAKDNLWGGRNQ